MKLIGITGVIGSGKSCVARMLAACSFLPLLSADRECAALLMPGKSGWQALHATLGADFFQNDGSLDRPALRQAMFSDPLLRQRIDALLHPMVRAEIFRIAAAQEQHQALVEVPLLFEAGWEADFNTVIVGYAPAATCLRRIMERDRVDRQGAAQALKAQYDIADKALQADHVIDNSGSHFATELQVCRLAKQLLFF